MEKLIQEYEKVLGKEDAEKIINESKAIAEDKNRLDEFLADVERKIKDIPKIGEVLVYAPLFAQIIRSYLNRDYDKLPSGTLVAMVLALFYLINPVDVIPDIIPGVGAVDDALVFTITASLIKSDVDDYVKWRDNKNE